MQKKKMNSIIKQNGFVKIFLLLLFNLTKINTEILQENKNLNLVEQLKPNNFLIGIFDYATTQSKNTRCVQDMKSIFKGIESKEIWALKLIDEFGHIPSSFTWGDNYWYSPKVGCDSINNQKGPSYNSRYNHTVGDEFFTTKAPVTMEFQMIYANYSTKNQFDLQLQILQKLHIGLCVPKSCKKNDMISYAEGYFDQKKLLMQNYLDIEIDVIDGKVLNFNLFKFLMEPSVILFLLIVCILICFCAVGIFLDILYLSIKNELKKGRKDIKFELMNVRNFFTCFNGVTNYNSLRQNNEVNSSNFISILPGLRSFVCFWIILLHINWHSMYTYRNTLQMIISLDSLIGQPILQGFYYVDAFFTISSILLSFNFLQNKKQIELIQSNCFKKNVKLFLKIILHRYLRLVPVVIVNTLLSDIIYTYLEINSPFYMNPTSDLYCRETWYLNIFFVNNWYSQSEICGSWAWYLSCDIQFFIIFLAVLFLYTKNKSIGKSFYFIIMVGFLIISYYLHYKHQFSYQYDVYFNTAYYLYNKPWTRINSYTGGVLIGYLMHKYQQTTIKINRNKLYALWLSTIVIFLASITMSHFKEMPIWLACGLQTFGKLLLSFYIGGIVFMCHKGYGGQFAEFLNSNFFIHLGKLSFGMYMVSPLITTLLFGLKRNASYFDEMDTAMNAVGVWGLSYLCAILLATFVEIPLVKVSEKFLLKKSN